MIAPSFPRTQGTLSRETYLTLVLLALVHQADGELHIAAPSFETIDSGGRLLIDWDPAAQQLVVRSGSPGLVVAEVRGTGWTTATAPPIPAEPAPPSSHRVMTEDQLVAELERRVRRDLLRQWKESGSAAVASMPPPEGEEK